MPRDTQIRYRRMVGDLCVDEDRHDFGVIEIVRDGDDQLVLMAESTWFFIARFNMRSDFADLDVEPGIYSLGYFAALRPEPLVLSLGSHPVGELLWAVSPDSSDDLRQHAAQADPDVDYCVAAPHCLQDVVHRKRGYPICALHDQQMSEVDSLID